MRSRFSPAPLAGSSLPTKTGMRNMKMIRSSTTVTVEMMYHLLRKYRRNSSEKMTQISGEVPGTGHLLNEYVGERRQHPLEVDPVRRRHSLEYRRVNLVDVVFHGVASILPGRYHCSGMPSACTCTALTPHSRRMSARSPNNSSLPSEIRAMRSHISSTSDMICVLNMMVAPACRCSSRICFMSLTLRGSSPEKGSSRMSNRGR